MSALQTPKDQIVIEPLTLDNLDSHVADIAKIYAFAVLNSVATVELEPPSRKEMSARIVKTLKASYPAVVARDLAGRVVGYAYGSTFRNAAAFRPAMEHSIFVDSNARGCGVGRKLLTTLVEAATVTGEFRQMIAVVEASQLNSLAFHEAMGFVEVGRMSAIAYKHEQWCTTVFLQLALGDGDTTQPMS